MNEEGATDADDEEEEEEDDERSMFKNKNDDFQVCVCCLRKKTEIFLNCIFCKKIYHKKCLKKYLYTNPTCIACKAYDFVILHQRNFHSLDVSRNYNLQVFYARVFQCIKLNARKKLAFLLSRKIVDKEIEDTAGNTLLNVACFYDHIEIVKMLISEFDLNPYHANHFQDFAAHICAQAGNVEILKYLMHKYPDCVYLLNSKGQLPLHVAILYSNPDIAYVLVNMMNDSKLDLEDENGKRPIQLCIESNPVKFKHVIRSLILLGCKNI
jgi:ankyrin repeat protein